MRATIEAFLAASGLEWEPGARDDEYVVALPGEKKLKTITSLVVSDTALSVSAFVIRNPDENHAEVYRHLLQRNLRLSAVGLAYAIDASGDVYVVGRMLPQDVTSDSLDALFGAMLGAADAPFNELLALGFLTSMKREWHWRISRGESLRNLEAFRHLLEHSEPPPSRAMPQAADPGVG